MKKLWLGGKVCNAEGWQNSNNWKPPGVPGEKDNVIIGEGVSLFCLGGSIDMSKPLVAKSLTVCMDKPMPKWLQDSLGREEKRAMTENQNPFKSGWFWLLFVLGGFGVGAFLFLFDLPDWCVLVAGVLWGGFSQFLWHLGRRANIRRKNRKVLKKRLDEIKRHKRLRQ